MAIPASSISAFGGLTPDLQQFVSYLQTSNHGRARLTSIAIAKVVADRAPLPSSPLMFDSTSQLATSIRSYFKTNNEIPVLEYINTLNELILIDRDAVTEYVYQFYLARYRVLFPAKTIFMFQSELPVLQFFGLSWNVDAETVSEINKNPVDLMRMYNGMQELYDAYLSRGE